VTQRRRPLSTHALRPEPPSRDEAGELKHSLEAREATAPDGALNALEVLQDEAVLNRTTAARGLYVYEAVDVLTLIDGIQHDLRVGA